MSKFDPAPKDVHADTTGKPDKTKTETEKFVAKGP